MWKERERESLTSSSREQSRAEQESERACVGVCRVLLAQGLVFCFDVTFRFPSFVLRIPDTGEGTCTGSCNLMFFFLLQINSIPYTLTVSLASSVVVLDVECPLGKFHERKRHWRLWSAFGRETRDAEAGR